MIVIPGKPSDPTRVELIFHSDGRMVVKRIGAQGLPEETEFPAAMGYLLDLIANPGAEIYGEETRHGAFFRINITREW